VKSRNLLKINNTIRKRESLPKDNLHGEILNRIGAENGLKRKYNMEEVLISQEFTHY